MGILLFLLDKGEVRFTDLSKQVKSRGTFSYAIRELEQDGLIQRRLADARPAKAFYSLTAKGKKVASHLKSAQQEIV